MTLYKAGVQKVRDLGFKALYVLFKYYILIVADWIIGLLIYLLSIPNGFTMDDLFYGIYMDLIRFIFAILIARLILRRIELLFRYQIVFIVSALLLVFIGAGFTELFLLFYRKVGISSDWHNWARLIISTVLIGKFLAVFLGFWFVRTALISEYFQKRRFYWRCIALNKLSTIGTNPLQIKKVLQNYSKFSVQNGTNAKLYFESYLNIIEYGLHTGRKQYTTMEEEWSFVKNYLNFVAHDRDYKINFIVEDLQDDEKSSEIKPFEILTSINAIIALMEQDSRFNEVVYLSCIRGKLRLELQHENEGYGNHADRFKISLIYNVFRNLWGKDAVEMYNGSVCEISL